MKNDLAWKIVIAGLIAGALPSFAQQTVVPYTFNTIAGQPGNAGWADSDPSAPSPGASAQFAYPTALAADSYGDLYVADQGNHVIRKMFQSGGLWAVTTFAGQPGNAGWADSDTNAPNLGASALFNQPTGITVDKQGNVYVADAGNNAIREITPGGAVTTIAGDTGDLVNGAPKLGYLDTTALQSQFSYPTGVAVDNAGNVYVVDENNNVIRKLTRATSMVSTLAGLATDAGFGTNDGMGVAAQFNQPYGLTIDTNRNLYVADLGNNTIREVTPNGTVSTFAGSPFSTAQQNLLGAGTPLPNQDGTGFGASFYFPYGVSADSAGNLFVADTYHNEIRKVSPQREVTTIGGMPQQWIAFSFPPEPLPSYQDGSGASALFGEPCGVTVDNQGIVYVADTENSVIRIGAPPTIHVNALEVTQVIQDWQNSVSLVQGKETYVRAHLQNPLGNNPSVTVSGAYLLGFGPDGSPLGLPLHPINKGGQITVSSTDASQPLQRGDFASTLNFRLPPAWTSNTITLQLAWPGGLLPINQLPSDCSVQVTFNPMPPLLVDFYPFKWTDNKHNVYQVDQPTFKTLYKRVLNTYPVANLIPRFKSPLSVPYTGQQPTDQAVEDALRDASDSAEPSPYRLVHGVLPVNPSVLQPWLGDTPKIGGPISYSLLEGTQIYGALNGRQTVSHELAHSLGLNHDVDLSLFGRSLEIDYPKAPVLALGACAEVGPSNYVYQLFQPFQGYPNGAPALGPMTEGSNSLIYGLDTLTLKDPTHSFECVVSCTNSDPTASDYYFDLMSYCLPPLPADEHSWPSSVTYEALTSLIFDQFSPSASPDLAPLPPRRIPLQGIHKPRGPIPEGGGASSYLVVEGSVNLATGDAQFKPCLMLTTTNTPPTEPAGTNFTVEALDSGGNVLQSSQFSLAPAFYGEVETNVTSTFAVYFTSDASIHALVLLENGVVAATLTAGTSTPTIQLTAPTGPQTYNGDPINITWTGSDADGDSLVYTAQFSADDGNTWETLGVDLTNENLEVDSSLLKATTQGLLRVVASDGLHLVSAESATPITIMPHSPDILINTPVPGEVYVGDQQLFLDATILDMQDGFLDGTNVQWSSDLSGAIGSGAVVNFDAQNLAEGYHTITVTATDADGLTNAAQTQILILHFPPPQLAFQLTPATNLLGTYYPPYETLSWPSYYTNYALQSSSNVAAGWTNVSNSFPEINGLEQQVRVNLSTATLFFRLALQL